MVRGIGIICSFAFCDRATGFPWPSLYFLHFRDRREALLLLHLKDQFEKTRGGTGSRLSPLLSSLYAALSTCRQASATFFRRKIQADYQYTESTFQLI